MNSRRPYPSVFDRQPYLTGIYAEPERLPADASHPFNLAFVPTLDLSLDRFVTFFVGENGSGKSTLLEAIAELCGFSADGGGSNERGASALAGSSLARVLRPRFRHRPPDGFFFRAETLFNFASTLEARANDPGFGADPYARYGGRSLHHRSHGEAFLDVFQHRIRDGLFLLDEPEAALSPQRQLALLHLLNAVVRARRTQVIIATHSPLLLTFPGAGIVDFDSAALPLVGLRETRHFQVMRSVLDSPDRFWRDLDPDA